jgi:hypothetical protein
MKIIAFTPRFVPEYLIPELSQMWHTSAIPISGGYSTPGERKHKRMLWTAQEFHKFHPELIPTAIYKDLDVMLEQIQ